MTAGRGVVHSELPEQEDGRMEGFQLWLNLASKDKMRAPWYRDIQSAEIPEFIPPPKPRFDPSVTSRTQDAEARSRSTDSSLDPLSTTMTRGTSARCRNDSRHAKGSRQPFQLSTTAVTR